MSRKILSWGNYPYHPQQLHSVSWRDEIPQLIDEITARNGDTLAFGNGRSYGDSCLAASSHLIHTRNANRFIHVDWNTGRMTAEAGVTLAEIADIAIPNGWFLSVTPGTKFATLGGAIANDVHGKNHHIRGTFGNHVIQFSLVRSDGETLLCSKDNNSDYFSATVGGLGLTGIIEWVEIQLLPIKSTQINTVTERFDAIEDFFNLSSELDHKHEYSVAWIDCLAKGRNTGRGVLILGDHSQYGNLIPDHRRSITLPVTAPTSLVNKFTLRLMNETYWHKQPAKRTTGNSEYAAFFYPLDAINYWNRAYGRRGFQQYQCVIPEKHAEIAIKELLSMIAKFGRGSFLAVLKRCGNIASPGLLSFPMEGTSLALDFPQHQDLADKLFPILDLIVKEAGGRLYPAKDAHMSGSDFRLGYPDWEIIENYRDKKLNSLFWKRVTL
ncbi:FAD-binding protein [Pseudomonas siliginis]|uniref:FAD-binding oxidoreductase n=1 Tax=Pseudomonas siliginis TaxID=2842346 RepID=UPI003C2D5D16